MTTNFMGDDERVRKEMANRYAEAKLKAEELKDAKVSEITIPDALVDDVVGVMCGKDGKKGTRVCFVNGPWDGIVEYMKSVPEVFQVRTEPPQVHIVGRKVAVSIFYEVAVYELQRINVGSDLVYRFVGYSECMEGLG